MMGNLTSCKQSAARVLLALIYHAAVACLVCLSVVEKSYAFKVNDPTKGAVIPCTKWDPNKGISLFVPECSGWGVRGGRTVFMRYNALGHRDRNYAGKKTDVLRVLLLGPSFLAGPGLEERQTLPRKLESLLRRRHGKIEVINGGTEGYFTTQTAIRFQEYVTAYNPDMVLFFLAAGPAMFMDYMLYPAVRFDEAGSPVMVENTMTIFKSWFPVSVRDFVLSDRTMVRFSLYYTASRQALRIQRTMEAYLSPGGVLENLLEPQVRYLKSMARFSKKMGVPFHVLWDKKSTIRNSYNEGNPGYLPLARIFQRFVWPMEIAGDGVGNYLKKEGIELLTLEMPTNEIGAKILLDGDYHLNEVGSLAAARIFANTLSPVISEHQRNKTKRIRK